MPAPDKCPGCGTKLLPDWESCPNCPLSFTDAPPERGALQNDNFRSFGLPAILFGGLAFGMWSFSQFMWRTAEENAASYETNAKNTISGKQASSSKLAAGVVPVDSKAIQGLVNEQVTGVYDPEGVLPEEKKAAPVETGPGIVSITPAGKTVQAASREWRMRGTIYDLVTLKPVPGVHMIFTDNATNSRAQIKTDGAGRYKVILPPLTNPDRGYLVALSRSGYEKAYLNPGTEGVAEKPLEERTQLARELSTLIAEPASLQPNSEEPLITDFHMAPKP